MGAFEYFFLIPIVAIVMGVIGKMHKRTLEHYARMAELRMKSQVGADEALRSELETLRREVASLRDTSTQYDLSLQHVLETVDQRVANIEVRLRTLSPTSGTALEQQIRRGP